MPIADPQLLTIPLLEAGISLTVVGSILGWSGSTMVLMAKRYGHIGAQAKHDAVAVLDRSVNSQPGPTDTAAFSTTLSAATPTKPF